MDRRLFQRSFPRAAAELALIFVGVLLAFQFETWQGSREDALRATEQLQALEVDFLETRDRLTATILQQERMLKLSATLVDMVDGIRPVTADPDSIRSMFGGGALSWWRSEPVTGAYDAMISAGDVGLIGNGDLRRLLAEYAADVEAGFEDHTSSMDLLNRLYGEVDEMMLSFSTSNVRDRVGVAPHTTSPSTEAVATLVSNQSFGGLLLWKSQLETNRLEYQRALLGQVDTILMVLAQELAGRD